MIRWRNDSRPSQPSESRGFDRRMCEPNGQAKPLKIGVGLAEGEGALVVADRGPEVDAAIRTLRFGQTEEAELSVGFGSKPG